LKCKIVLGSDGQPLKCKLAMGLDRQSQFVGTRKDGSPSVVLCQLAKRIMNEKQLKEEEMQAIEALDVGVEFLICENSNSSSKDPVP
jgi:hypothetical protein